MVKPLSSFPRLARNGETMLLTRIQVIRVPASMVDPTKKKTHLFFLLFLPPLLFLFWVDAAVHKDNLDGRRRGYKELPPVPHPTDSTRDSHAAQGSEARPARGAGRPQESI